MEGIQRPGDERIAEVLGRLCEIPGPSGHERAVRDHLERAWSSAGLEASVDRMGNLLARVGGSGPRVLVQAHMDEVGYLVRHVTDDGFIFLDSAQGGRRDEPERRFVVGQSALVLGREGVVAHGVFVSPSGHVMTPSQLQKPTTLSDFFLEVYSVKTSSRVFTILWLVVDRPVYEGSFDRKSC